MIEKILYVILLSIFSGILYRMGGAKGYNTKFRDIGVPLCAISVLSILGVWHSSLIISAVIMFGALTTYWKRKGEEALWYHWYLHSLGCALSMLPFIYFNRQYAIGGVIYIILMPIIATIASIMLYDAVEEEFARGIIITSMIQLLLIQA